MSDLEVEPIDEEATTNETEPDAVDGRERPSEGDRSERSDNTIEVTPTESVDEEIDETTEAEPVAVDGPEYVLYGGKGGVGKTTMAAASALSSAEEGISTLVVSTDPAHSLSDTYETDIPSEPTRIREDVPLYAAEIDPEAAIAEGQAALGGGAPGDDRTGAGDGARGDAGGEDAPFGDEDAPFGGADGPFGHEEGGPFGGAEGPLGGMGDLLGEGGVEDLLSGGMPGSDEAVAMQTLLEYLDDPRFDRVIVDTAPTGHTLRLLQLPDLLDTMVGRMMKLRQRLSGMMDGIKGMFGAGPAEEGQGMDELEDLAERIERLRSALRDPSRTDFRIVMVPEEMSVLESKRLRSRLGEFEIPVKTVVVNRIMEPLTDVTDELDESIEPGVGADVFLEPNLDSCEFCQRRWDVQQSALVEAQELFRGTDVRRVPLLAEEVRGGGMLRVVAACLRHS